MSRYTAKIYMGAEHRPDEKSFCVALLSVPDFPDNRQPIPAIEAMGGRLLSVVGCNDDTGRWGYVSLSDGEKDSIGDALQRAGAEIGIWYWCTLFEHKGEAA